MYIYKITYKDGKKEVIRANSPKQAEELASNGVVSFIKFLR